jgi:hypothetical protein
MRRKPIDRPLAVWVKDAAAHGVTRALDRRRGATGTVSHVGALAGGQRGSIPHDPFLDAAATYGEALERSNDVRP